jgi:hypothetical protein
MKNLTQAGSVEPWTPGDLRSHLVPGTLNLKKQFNFKNLQKLDM